MLDGKFGFKKPLVMGIDIAPSEVRVIALSTPKRRRREIGLESINRIRIEYQGKALVRNEPYPVDSHSERQLSQKNAISDALNRVIHPVKKHVATTVACVSHQRVISRSIPLANLAKKKLNDDQLRALVFRQIRKINPDSESELCVDYGLDPGGGNAMASNILEVTACRRQLVDDLMDIASNAGVKLDVVEVDSKAWLRLYRYWCAQHGRNSQDCVMWLRLSPLESKMMILTGQNLLLVRELHFSLGVDEVVLPVLQELAGQITQEWRRFLSVSNELDSPQEVVLCGEYAMVSGVAECLGRYLGDQFDGAIDRPVRIWDCNINRSNDVKGAASLEVCFAEEESNSLNSQSRNYGFELALGLALRGAI